MNVTESNKVVQHLTLELLKKFIAICEEYHLVYFMTGGALIGTKRHGGFVPWDDDIDIVMPRKDFDQFHKIAQNLSADGYGICDRHNDTTWHFAFLQFIDNQSEIEINLADKPRLAHIWIDVYPLDGAPSSRLKRKGHIRYIMLHRYLIQMAFVHTQSDSYRNRPLLEKLAINFLKKVPVGKLVHEDLVFRHMEKLLRKWEYDTSAFVGNFLGRYRAKEIVPRSYFGTPIKECFETIKVNCPEKGHELLSALYGDYMKLPPEKERVAHNVKIIRMRDTDAK